MSLPATRCTAQSKQTGRQCGAYAVNGSTKCHYHGGKSLSGIASPVLTTGKHSKHLPTRLLASYNERRSDPDLVAVADELALTDARIGELLGRVDTGESGEIWKSIKATYAAGEKARRAHDATGDPDQRQTFFEAWEAVGILIGEGIADREAWSDVFSLVEQRRKLAETETKRREKLGQMITADRAMVLMSAVLGLIRENVSDRHALDSIQRGVERLITQGAE